jgi:type I restriction enzyme M protein
MTVKDLNVKYSELPKAIQDQIDSDTGKIRDFISDEWVEATPEEVEAVQVFARRLVEDYGYPKEQIQTHPQFRVRKRPSDERREYPVDIAIFRNNQRTESELFMIVECKQPEKNRGLRQLKIYMDLSPANVGVWYNGKDHAYIRKVQKIDGTLDYVEMPNIPKRGQRIEDIGQFKRKDLRPTANLKAVFRDIRNHLSQQAVGITRDETLAGVRQ